VNGNIKIKESKNKKFDLFNNWEFALTVYLLVTVIIFSLSSSAFAAEADRINNDYVHDLHVTRVKMVQAPDAEDMRQENSGNITSDATKDNSYLKNLNTGNNESPVNIEADSLQYDNILNLYKAIGKVTIFYSGVVLSADNLELDNKNNVATAQGNAFLKMGEDSLRGEKIIYNIEDKTGAAYKANAFYARNNFYVRGDKIEKTGESTYFIEQPAATTCDGDDPDWQITGSEMDVTIEGYGSMRNACFRVKGIPILYSPYIIFPAKTKRQTGFLLPYLGYSKNKDGMDIELPFFWAISQQMDATFYQRYIEKRGFKEGAEFRYYLGDKSFGTFYGDFIEDTKHVTKTTDEATIRDWQEMHTRWSYYLNHQTNFDSQFYLRTDLVKVSDKWYFKDFTSHNYYLDNYSNTAEDSFKNVPFKADESLRYLTSTVRLYKGWSNYNVIGLINYTEDFAAVNNDKTLQRYPQIIVTGVKQQFLNTPLYYELAGTYDYLYREEGDRGHFVDFSPSVSMPLNISGYAKLTPQFTLKETFWNSNDDQTDSKNKNKNKDKNKDKDKDKDKDETDDRTLYNASVSLSSQLSRVFDLNVGSWEKIRHEIKPEIIYSYIPNVSSDNVPDYYLPASSAFIMPVPTLSGDTLTEQNAVAWSLTNTLTAKVRDEAGKYSYLEFFRLRLFQTYDVDEDRKDMEGSGSERKPFSDMGIELDLTPYKYFSFRARDRYNIYSGWKQNNYDLLVRDWRDDLLSIGYRKVEDSIEEINLGLKAVITGNIYGTYVLKRDLLNSRRIENSVGLVYHKQCWSMGLEYTETDDDVRFLFKISLAGFNKLGVQ